MTGGPSIPSSSSSAEPTPPPYDPAASARGTAGPELARGAFLSVLTLVAANLRGVFTFLVARLLGRAALGTYSLAFASMDLLSKVGSFGMDTGTTTLVARREAEGDRAGSRRILRRAVVAGLLLSVLAAVLGIVYYQTLGLRLGQPPELVLATSLMLLAIPGVSLYRISNGVSRGLKLLQHDIYSRGLTESLVTVGAFLVAWLAGLGALAPIVAVLVGTAAQGAVAFALVRAAIGRADKAEVAEGASVGRGDERTARLLAFSAPIAGYNLLNVLIHSMDVLLLGYFVGRAPGLTLESFGVFCAAVEIAGFMRKVRQTFDPIFTPVLAGQAVRGELGPMRDTVAQVSRWVVAVTLPLVGVFAFSGSLVLSVYGKSFAAGGLWLALLAVAHGTGAVVGVAETVILVERPWLNLLNSALTTVMLLVASLLLIPRHGATGAAVSMICAYVFQGVLRYGELRLLFGRSWPWGALERPLAAFLLALVPALAAKFLASGLAADLAAGLLFLGGYLAAWRWLGLDAADRETLAELGWLGRRARR